MSSVPTNRGLHTQVGATTGLLLFVSHLSRVLIIQSLRSSVLQITVPSVSSILLPVFQAGNEPAPLLDLAGRGSLCVLFLKHAQCSTHYIHFDFGMKAFGVLSLHFHGGSKPVVTGFDLGSSPFVYF